MTVDGTITIGALLVLIAEVGCSLLAWAFCVRAAPLKIRVWRGVALAIVAALVVARLEFDYDLTWGRGVAWVHLGIAGCAILLFNLRTVAGSRGDRCP